MGRSKVRPDGLLGGAKGQDCKDGPSDILMGGNIGRSIQPF